MIVLLILLALLPILIGACLWICDRYKVNRAFQNEMQGDWAGNTWIIRKELLTGRWRK